MKNFKLLSLSVVSIFVLGMFWACDSEQEADDADAPLEVTMDETTTEETSTDLSTGEQIYKNNCMVCHMENGLGLAGTFPPLAKSDYLLADKNRAILQTLVGSKEPITINGIEYPGSVMTIVELNEQQTVDVVNYILNSWGNEGGTVTLEDVKAAKAKK